MRRSSSLSGKQRLYFNVLFLLIEKFALTRSLEFNLKSRVFNELFPELRKEAEEEVIENSEDDEGGYHDAFHQH